MLRIILQANCSKKVLRKEFHLIVKPSCYLFIAILSSNDEVDRTHNISKKRKGKRSEPETEEMEGSASGRWTKEEHRLFIEALKLYGRDWKKVQQHVGTRTTTQARSHAQKYFAKAEKESITRKDSFSQASTALNSPVSKTESKVEKKLKRKRTSIVVTKEKPSLKENSLLEAKKKLIEPNTQNQSHISPDEQQKDLNEDYSIPMYEYVSQLMYPTQNEIYNTDKSSIIQEIEFDFDSLFPEPIKPLELTANMQQPLTPSLTEAESIISIDFSNAFEF